MDDSQDLRGVLMAASDAMAKEAEKASKAQHEIDRGIYSPDYVESELKPIIKAAEDERREIARAARRKVDALAGAAVEKRRAAAALDGAALTDDVRLLGTGILDRCDYTDLFKRNADNPTMVELIARDAERAGCAFTKEDIVRLGAQRSTRREVEAKCAVDVKRTGAFADLFLTKYAGTDRAAEFLDGAMGGGTVRWATKND